MLGKRLRLKNFRNHHDLTIDLSPGVTGIVGENGQGKSSIIEALQFVITGELFEGSKEEAITLGEDCGWVEYSFELDGKAGRLERHLDASKVVLEYDGVTHKKAGEVKELWDKLLQINADIFKKVIVARQGQISQLFSGDQSVREKIFQKIFLVPPTDKLRTMLYEKYIKTAPLELPAEDLIMLNALLQQINTSLAQVDLEIHMTDLFSEEEVDQLKQRLIFLQKCRQDAAEQKDLQISLGYEQHLLEDAQSKRAKIVEKLGKVNIDAWVNNKTMMEQQRALYLQRLKLEEEQAEFEPLDTLNASLTELQGRYQTLDLARNESQTRFDKVTALMEGSMENLKHWQDLSCNRECPTCRQPLGMNVDTAIQTAKQRIKDYRIERDNLAETIVNLRAEFKEVEENVKWCREQILRVGFVENQIAQLAQVTFDAEVYSKTCKVIEHYNKLKEEQAELVSYVADQKARVAKLTQRLQNLSVYDGGDGFTDLEGEIRNTLQNLDVDRTARVRVQELTVQSKTLSHQLKTVEERIIVATDATAKNQKRKAYLDKLQSVYDLLHTSQFPRQLIMSYADLVTEYLDEYLSMFHIPYRAKVNDNFKIDMVDDEGRVLPKVSGGQEIVIGISLHLALHDLFSQSFPLMVIDEGTTHLSTKNRKAYFEVISMLKEKAKVKQILIIDHDENLSTVVDQVIQL